MHRRIGLTASTAVLLAALTACSAPDPPAAAPPAGAPAGPATDAPAPPPATPPVPRPHTPPDAVPPAGDPPAVLVGAGDIASCAATGDSRTAALLDDIAGTVFTLGDNAYDRGSPAEFAQCYGPTWGRHRTRTRPVIGNHEYGTPGAAGYFRYFGDAAGDSGRGYYSYDTGSWHVVALNTNCGSVRGGCAAGSPQERWLRADLAASTARCTVAMAHHPLFTSGLAHPPATETRALVQALYDAGVEILLTGHNHQYERFAPQTPTGRRDDARGIRAFVVGTGGAAHYGFGTPQRNSEVRDNRTYGVLRLTLRSGDYRWDFLPAAGGDFTDTGRGTCH